MPIPDDQLALLKTARDALHGWQTAADGVGVVIQQMVMVFPPGGKSNLVTFTWDDQEERFDVST